MYLQAELIVGGYKQYGLELGKSAEQIKAEIEPFTVPPVIISGFADVPSASDDITEAEVKDKFKEVFASLSEADKAVRRNRKNSVYGCFSPFLMKDYLTEMMLKYT